MKEEKKIILLIASFLLEFERQQVSSGLQNSSLYSSQSQQCWALDGPDSPSDFQFFPQAFSNRSKRTNSNWYHYHFHVPRHFFFSSLSSIWVFVRFLSFSLYDLLERQNPLDDDSLVGWGCRIHRLLLCRGVRPTPHECPGYDTKQSKGEVPIMLELWGMQSTPSLPSLPGPVWHRVVELNCVLMLNWIAWNRTVLTFKLCIYAKLKCLKWNCFSMLTELFEMELFLTLKLYLR